MGYPDESSHTERRLLPTQAPLHPSGLRLPSSRWRQASFFAEDLPHRLDEAHPCVGQSFLVRGCKFIAFALRLRELPLQIALARLEGSPHFGLRSFRRGLRSQPLGLHGRVELAAEPPALD